MPRLPGEPLISRRDLIWLIAAILLALIVGFLAVYIGSDGVAFPTHQSGA